MTYKVLIVDDSKLARMAVAKALTALRPEWTRVEAANADDALALATDSDIDVTLLDFNMPGRNGLELAAELRALNPSMPVAVITANIQTEIVTRAQEVGASFLAKPLTQPALAAFLDEAVQRLQTARP
ncbi:response regulator transcription factor [Caulobacter sp. S45]|uniref:response regulator transcription factor n=1 Tax=Caulobacter sp. S45 TaxID=1641861 RepID=UPI00131B2463|nr:response regulator [Caulobacter sp. S45]